MGEHGGAICKDCVRKCKGLLIAERNSQRHRTVIPFIEIIPSPPNTPRAA